MGALFQRQSGPTRINGVQINQSLLGYPVPVVMGKGKVQQSILWMDGFNSTMVSTSAGKGLGGKTGDQYAYSADVIAGLCDGGANGINGIGDAWTGQSWLSNSDTVESYTIPATNAVYTPSQADAMTGDHGVSFTVPVAVSYSDLGAPAPTTLAVTSTVSLQRVPYVAGQALSAGTYSVDSSNNYYFSTANAGLFVQLYYTFALGTIKKQVNALVPSSLVVLIDGNIPYLSDCGVVYYSTAGDSALNGTRLTRVYNTPTAAGTYYVDPGDYSVTGSTGNYTVTVNRAASYKFASADINQEVQITFKLDNSTSLPAGTQTSLAFQLIPGTPTDAPAALLTTNYPSAALGYPRIAKLLYSPMDLGYGAQVQQNTFEVMTADAWGGGNPDCNPVQCILKVLSDAVWGLGQGTVPFPQSAIDNGPNGTWGSGNAGNGGNGATAYVAIGGPAAHITEPTATAWFAANNFFISPVIDRQDTAASLIARWLEAGMCAAFISEGLMKLSPYGDTSASANGRTWTAPSSFDAELDDTCFLVKNTGDDPVKISSSPWTEAYNKVQVSWNNRANQYAPEVTPEEDKAAVNRYGSRTEDAQAWDFITTLPAARFAGSMRVKRNVYTRNTYTFSLGFRFGALEPMAIVSLTTNSAWSDSTRNTIQLVRQPVRITKIVDNPDGTYDVTCEDFIFGTAQPATFNKALATPAEIPNQYADPGSTYAAAFVATQRLCGYFQNQLWIGAAGDSENWGGCNIFASMDGNTYAQLGTITKAARIGTLAAILTNAAVDPDTVDSLIVELTGNTSLESATQADADAGTTLCAIASSGGDGGNLELVAYSACALTGPDTLTGNTNAYKMSGYIRRGLMGTPILFHEYGSQFLRLDDAIFKLTYDPSWAGKNIFFKFQSFNTFGNSAQDISTLTAFEFPVPPAASYGAVNPTTGAVSFVCANFTGGIK